EAAADDHEHIEQTHPEPLANSALDTQTSRSCHVSLARAARRAGEYRFAERSHALGGRGGSRELRRRRVALYHLVTSNRPGANLSAPAPSTATRSRSRSSRGSATTRRRSQRVIDERIGRRRLRLHRHAEN